nr:MAG TPA: hypothetical protein [Caudoviricetes sp.]
MGLNKERKRLNRDLKEVVRGYAPSYAFQNLYRVWLALLDESDNEQEIMQWCDEMTSACMERQTDIFMGAIEQGIVCRIAVDMEEQDNE